MLVHHTALADLQQSRSAAVVQRSLGIDARSRIRCTPVACKASSAGVEQQGMMANKNSDLLQKYRDSMAVPMSDLERVRDDFVDQMRASLAEEGASSLPMIPTLVDILPDGHEHGKFFSIDLGGTNLRVMYVKLPREHGVVDVVESEENLIPDGLRSGPQEELFDYLVDTLMAFADRIGWNKPTRSGQPRRMIVGFCFSFPIQQTAIDHGTLIKWVKGFENEDAVGKDVMDLLRDAFQRKQVKAEVTALVNDTVGTLASAQYGDSRNHTDTCISIIVGTGTNCCYLEQLGNIQKYQPSWLPRTSDMVVNTEWADYSSEALPWIEEDRLLDADSKYPREHAFEKMTSGLYMGDLARRILLTLAQEGGLFGGRVPPRLRDDLTLSTPQMERIHEDASEDRSTVAAVVQEVFDIAPADLSLDVRLQVQEVCQLVAVRGARLIAAGVAGILRHLGRDVQHEDDPKVVIASEGAVLRKYTTYRREVQRTADELMPDVNVSFEPAPVLSGTLGAALVAAASQNYMSGLSFYELD